MAAVRQLSTRAIAWRLDRRDGLRLGFTSHDRRVRIGSLDHHPQPGLKLTSVRRSGSFEPGGLDIEGALDSALLTQDDLLSGRWNDARIAAFSFDWQAPDADIRSILHARMARFSIVDAVVRAELIEDRPDVGNGVPRTAPGCRAVFTGRECGLSPARFRHEARVTAIDGAQVTLDSVPATDIFPGGSLRWLDGPNCGLRQAIVAQEGSIVRLSAAPYFRSEPVLAVELIEGCDHDFATCSSRFDNAVNFRGEPHLPGMDFLTRYPGA